MSERFVEAFVVSPKKLAALLGTPALGYAAVAKAVKRKQVWQDVVMTLGDGDEADGLPLVKTGLDELAAGEAPSIHYGDRLTTLVLHAVAEPLKPSIMESNHMPSDESGLWTPAFRALGMKTIARQWGKPTLAFPHKTAPKVDWTWPTFTVVEATALAAWRRELATPWRAKLKTLPNTTFDPDADDAAEDAYMSRAEVERGIAVLEKWVASGLRTRKSRAAVATSGNALVLVLDGDR